jgi:hypothetical protein
LLVTEYIEIDIIYTCVIDKKIALSKSTKTSQT